MVESRASLGEPSGAVAVVGAHRPFYQVWEVAVDGPTCTELGTFSLGFLVNWDV